MSRSLNLPILLHDTGSRVCDTKRAVGVGGELDPVGSSTRAEVYSNHWIAEKVTADGLARNRQIVEVHSRHKRKPKQHKKLVFTSAPPRSASPTGRSLERSGG